MTLRCQKESPRIVCRNGTISAEYFSRSSSQTIRFPTYAHTSLVVKIALSILTEEYVPDLPPNRKTRQKGLKNCNFS